MRASGTHASELEMRHKNVKVSSMDRKLSKDVKLILENRMQKNKGKEDTMASSMIHLAIVQEMRKKVSFRDIINEGVWLYGGWWNWLNGIAGIINIFCMTGWWGIYSSKKQDDMLWPDMTIWFIVAYDIWNFTYTYNNLPTHTWYCGVALLLAPTFANALWNKGGWIQNRANTLAIWCMFAQVVPLFQVDGIFATLPVLYKYTGAKSGMELTHYTLEQMNAAGAYPVAQGVMAILAVVANVICISVIIKRAIEQKKNPYKNEIFAGTRDFEQAMDRA